MVSLAFNARRSMPDDASSTRECTMSDKNRIVDLQKQVRIARTALEHIKMIDESYSNRSVRIAESALDEIWKLDPKQPLQGVVGHERRRQ